MATKSEAMSITVNFFDILLINQPSFNGNFTNSMTFYVKVCFEAFRSAWRT